MVALFSSASGLEWVCSCCRLDEPMTVSAWPARADDRTPCVPRCGVLNLSTLLYSSIPFRLAGLPPASSPNQPDHVRSITRIRGAGEPGQEGALLRRESAPCRQLPLPPEPSTPGPAVEVSLSASSSPPPYTPKFYLSSMATWARERWGAGRCLNLFSNTMLMTPAHASTIVAAVYRGPCLL